MTEGTTSTFTIHHDRCDPSKWTISEWKALADFIRTGELSLAARLSRAGMQLLRSDHHEMSGGDVEHIGWATPDALGEVAYSLDELDIDDVTAVCAIYRGPTQYAVTYGVGDPDGNYEGSEHETFDTEAEAVRFLKSLTVVDPAE